MVHLRLKEWYCFEVRAAAIFSVFEGCFLSVVLVVLVPIISLWGVLDDEIGEQLEKPDNAKPNGSKVNLTSVQYALAAVSMIFGLLILIPHLLLLMGVKKNKPGFMLPYIWLSIVMYCMFIFTSLFTPTAAGANLPVLVFGIYQLVAVWSYYKNIKESQLLNVNAMNVGRA